MTRFGLSEPIVVGEYDEETNTYKKCKKLEDIVKQRPIKAETEVEIKSVLDLDYTKDPEEFQKDLDKVMENVYKSVRDKSMENVYKSVRDSLKQTDRFRKSLDNEKYLLLLSKIEDIIRDIFDISPDTEIKTYMFQNDDGVSIHIGNEHSIFMAKVGEIFRKTQCLKPEKEYK